MAACYLFAAALLQLIAHELVDDQTEKLIGLAVLIKPTQMFAAIAAVCGLPDVVFKPRVFVGSGTADIAARREFEAADQELKSVRIDEAMLMAAAHDQFFAFARDSGVAEAAQD